MSGFPAVPGAYFLARSTLIPPIELQKKILPYIEELELEVSAMKEENIKEGQVTNKKFIEFLKYGRLAILQDAPYIRMRFPTHFMFRHPVFKSRLYLEWEQQVL